jgi:hypothetical protein
LLRYATLQVAKDSLSSLLESKRYTPGKVVVVVIVVVVVVIVVVVVVVVVVVL